MRRADLPGESAATAAQLGTKGADPDAPPHRTDNAGVVAMMRGEGDLQRFTAEAPLPPVPIIDEARAALLRWDDDEDSEQIIMIRRLVGALEVAAAYALVKTKAEQHA